MRLVGSETLSRWRKLATPDLAGVLEHRPGVQIKGQHLMRCFEEEKYSIGDFEEDGTSPVINHHQTTAIRSFGHGCTLTALPRLTQPSTLSGTV